MNVAFALIADGASLSQEGKLTAFGVFNRVTLGSIPAVHLGSAIVLWFRLEEPDMGTTASIAVSLVSPTGEKVWMAEGTIEFAKREIPSPGYDFATHILQLPPLRFEEPGGYEIRVEASGSPTFSAPLLVEGPPAPAEEEGTEVSGPGA